MRAAALTLMSLAMMTVSAPAQSPTGSDDLPAVLATIGEQQITLADILARSADQLEQADIQFRRARHRIVNAALVEMLRERVLLAEAARRGRTLDQLIAAEAGGSMEPSEVAVAAWFAENKARLGGRTYDQVRAQIAEYLREQRKAEVTAQLEQRLNRERGVVVHLQPFRLQFNNANAPAKGRNDAPVTLVEFADFQCPFCAQFHTTIKRAEQQFGDKLQIVYRQFPITQLHPLAFKAAEASLCAHEQGKFWEFHDLLYQETGKLAVVDLKEKAQRLRLDRSKFDVCLDSDRQAAHVQRDYNEGIKVGITGTPALFVNGVFLEGGAVTFEALSSAIQKELDRVR